MGRVVPPVHAKRRVSGSFIHTCWACLWYLCFLEVQQCYKAPFKKLLRGWWHISTHGCTYIFACRHTTLTEVRRNGWSLVPPKNLLFINCGWLENPFWKRMSVSFYNSLIRQIKRAFLLVFSNQNMPQSLFTYLSNLCCPNRTYLCNGKGELKSSTLVIRERAQEDLENNGVILLQPINWKC